jgi:cytochrome c5
MDKWARSCALCHVTGNAGAPRIGNAEEWAPRLAQGMDVLLQHTLEGFNDMPPLGYCMSCERDDFVALIEFMGRDSEQTRDSGQGRDL